MKFDFKYSLCVWFWCYDSLKLWNICTKVKSKPAAVLCCSHTFALFFLLQTLQRVFQPDIWNILNCEWTRSWVLGLLLIRWTDLSKEDGAVLASANRLNSPLRNCRWVANKTRKLQISKLVHTDRVSLRKTRSNIWNWTDWALLT